MTDDDLTPKKHLLVLMPERFKNRSVGMAHIGDVPHGDAIVHIIGVNARTVTDIMPVLKKDKKQALMELKSLRDLNEHYNLQRRVGYIQNLCTMLENQAMQQEPDKDLLHQVATKWVKQALKPKDTVYLASLPSFPVQRAPEKNLMK